VSFIKKTLITAAVIFSIGCSDDYARIPLVTPDLPEKVCQIENKLPIDGEMNFSNYETNFRDFFTCAINDVNNTREAKDYDKIDLSGKSIAFFDRKELEKRCRGDVCYDVNEDSIITYTGIQANRLYNLIHHEIGHMLSPSEGDFVSMVAEAYFLLRLYPNSPEVAVKVMESHSRMDFFFSEIQFLEKYTDGGILAPLIISENNCDLEASLEDVERFPYLTLQARLEGYLDNLSGNNDMEKYLSAARTLFDKECFASLFKNESEANEFRGFFEFLCYESLVNNGLKKYQPNMDEAANLVYKNSTNPDLLNRIKN